MDTKAILKFDKGESIGLINSVDTGMSTAIVKDDMVLSQLQINQLLAIQSPKSGRFIIAMIVKIYRKASNSDIDETSDIDLDEMSSLAFNQLKLVFVGELIERSGIYHNVFRRNVSAVPSINAMCYRIDGERLTNLMKSISIRFAESIKPLTLGKYTIDDNSIAYLDGDKFFQRHAAIVGSTGSGKSYCVARIVEQMAELGHANAVLFDIHGEYSTEEFKQDGITQLKIAAPGDLVTANKLESNILMVPYWLLNYEEIQALLLIEAIKMRPIKR